MVLSPIQLKKHDNRKNSEGGPSSVQVTGKLGEEWTTFEKGGIGNIGGSS